jgi:hypothetical protein
MATITYKIEEPKKDKTRKVSITLSHKGIRKRIHTNITIKECDLTKQGKIKSDSLKRNIEDTVNTLKNRLYEIETSLGNKDADIEWIYSQLTGNVKTLDFFEYTRKWVEKSNNKGKGNYSIMLNSLYRFLKSDTLSFSDIDYNLLNNYKDYLTGHPRAQSLYLGCMRHIFNEAIREYNMDDNKVITNNPFNSFIIPKSASMTKNRIISDDNLIKLFNFHGTRRVGMARDCYILSFCLIGMNSVDLYECTSYSNGVLAYDRAKTRDRRTDNAHIEIAVPNIIKPLFDKYKGDSRVFNFYKKYSNAANFNKHINKGLHIIADILGIPHFDFYSARHTWASIARNRLGIDKYTIHEALNHVSDMSITDIYIQKDYTNINKANEKVIAYIEKLIYHKSK